MIKFLIALISLFVSINTYAQNIDKVDGNQNSSNGSAINIAISKYDLIDGNTLYDQASEAENKGDINTALTLFGKSAFEFNANRNLIRYGQAVMKMSQMHYQLGQFLDAEQILLNVVLKNYSKLGNKYGLMSAYYQLGKVYLASNKYTQSLWFYSQQGILAQQLRNNNSYIESILGIASVKIKKKDFTLASRDLNRAEFLASSIKSNQYTIQIKDARDLIGGRITLSKK